MRYALSRKKLSNWCILDHIYTDTDIAVIDQYWANDIVPLTYRSTKDIMYNCVFHQFPQPAKVSSSFFIKISTHGNIWQHSCHTFRSCVKCGGMCFKILASIPVWGDAWGFLKVPRTKKKTMEVYVLIMMLWRHDTCDVAVAEQRAKTVLWSKRHIMCFSEASECVLHWFSERV